MIDLSDQRARRVAAGVSLIVGPALMLVGWAMFPIADTNAEWALDVSAAGTRAAGGMALVIVGIAVSILAYMALVHLQRERQPLFGDIGGAIAIIGASLTGAMLGLVLAEVEAIRHLGPSTETAVLLDAIDDSAAAIVLWLGPLVWPVGLVVLAIGLARAHATPSLFAAMLGVGAAAQLVGLFIANGPIIIVGSAAMFIALAFIGGQLLVESDEDWEHVPVFEGFHRVSTV